MARLNPDRAFIPVRIAILTVSDTRTRDNDTSGDILAARIEAAGHTIAERAIIKDDAILLVDEIESWIDNPKIDAIISTGGTGLTGRDVTNVKIVDFDHAETEAGTPRSGIKIRYFD